MNTQVNVRLPDSFLLKARKYAEKKGFSNIQELIREALRDKIEEDVSTKELALVKKLVDTAEEKNLFVDKKEFLKAVNK